MRDQFKKYLNENSLFAGITVAIILICAVMFVAHSRFIYRTLNAPFTIESAGSGQNLSGFDKDSYNFVLKNLGYQVQDDSTSVQNHSSTPQAPAIAPSNQANPDFSSVKIEILNSISTSLTQANKLKSSLAALGFKVSKVAATTPKLDKNQIQVKDSIKTLLPNAFDAISKTVAKYGTTASPQTLEEGNQFDVIIILGSSN